MLVDDGQYAGGLLCEMRVGGSLGRSRYSTTRSTELCGAHVSWSLSEERHVHLLEIELEVCPISTNPIDVLRENLCRSYEDTSETRAHIP